MGREWKPGDVAMVTGVDGAEHRAVREVGGWSTPYQAWLDNGFNSITDARPLAVIDPRVDGSQVGYDWWLRRAAAQLNGKVAANVLIRLADRIEEQTKPPKPPEPQGLGAVVEDASHIRWVRISNTPGTFPWLKDGHGVEGWSNIAAVKVLSEGVS